MTEATVALHPGQDGTSESLASPTSEPVRSASKRLVSLDVFRGWTMFWIVGGAAILDSLQHLNPNPVLNAIIYELTHTE